MTQNKTHHKNRLLHQVLRKLFPSKESVKITRALIRALMVWLFAVGVLSFTNLVSKDWLMGTVIAGFVVTLATAWFLDND